MSKPNILVWDLETSDLKADWGYLLAAGYKTFGQKTTHVKRIDDFRQKNAADDKELVKAAAEVIGNADIWVTWYGTYFDVPFLQSRLIDHRLPLLPPVPHVDGWKIARYKLCLTSNRLNTVSEFLQISEKTPITKRVWREARCGVRSALDYVASHCSQDVKVLEEAYSILRGLAPGHPISSLGGVPGLLLCPTCGQPTIEKRGRTLMKTGFAERYYCATCGAWSKGPAHSQKGILRT